MSHELYSVSAFQIVAPFTLRIQFDDASAQTIDFSPLLRGELYGPLRDIEFFNQVRLDNEVGTLVWPNGADFDPATLHDWDRVGGAMTKLARSWRTPIPPNRKQKATRRVRKGHQRIKSGAPKKTKMVASR